MITAVTAAKTVCELSDWSLPNLSVQKILYIANMIHLGRHGEPLIQESFQAWTYGPILPTAYRKMKPFGAGAVKNIFRSTPECSDPSALQILKEAAEKLSPMSGAQLVAIAHWERGAWAKNYTPDMCYEIPTRDIISEYRNRCGNNEPKSQRIPHEPAGAHSTY